MLRFPCFAALLFGCLLPASFTEVAAQEIARKTPDGFPLPEGAIFRFGNRQMRHPEPISSGTASPDSKYLATQSSSCVVIWDLTTLSVKLKISGGYYGGYGFGDSATAVSFFPDSKSVLLTVRPTDRTSINTSEVTEQAQVWDLDTGKKRFGIKGGWSWVAAAWLVNGGKEIAFQSGYAENASISYVDAKDGKELRVVKTPGTNGGAWIASDANRIATPNGNREGIAVIDGKTGDTLYIVADTRWIQAALSPDGKRLFFHADTGTVHVHDIDAKKELFSFKHPADKQRGPMRVSKDQQTLYFGGQHGQLYRWDVKNNKQLPDVGRHSSWTLTSIALSPDESILYSMGGDRLIRRWDSKSGKQLPLPEGYITQTVPIASADGKHIIVADHAGAIDFWNVQTGKRDKQLQPNGSYGIDCLAISPDGKWLAGGRTTQDVQLWNLTADKMERTIPLVEKPDEKGGDHVKRVAFSPDSKVLYTASGKTGITAWEVPSGKKIWNAPVIGTLLSVDPKGRWLATGGGNDRPVKWTMLDAKTGKPVRVFEVVAQEPADPQANSYPPFVTDLAFTPDSSRLVSSHYDGTVHLWDPDAGKVLARARGIPRGQSTLAISPDGRWIGLGRGDRKITIFELNTMKEVLTLTGHDSAVRDVVFTRDGQGIVGNADLAPTLWSLEPKGLPSLETTSDSLWDALASVDGAKAFQHQWALIKNPATAIKLFHERIKPADLAIDREKFDQWVSALDSPLFRAREVAERDLTRAGMKIPVAWLRKALAEAKGDESPARLKRVLSIREKPDPTEWRVGRAVQVLELAGTDETKALLKAWSESGGSALAVDAKAALSRLR